MALLQGFAALLAISFIYWILFGGLTRANDRREANRRHGGRKPRDRSFWSLPARDRPYAPGMLLLLFAVVALAEIVLDAASQDPTGSATVAAAVLGGIVAAGFRWRPDLVATGMGILGVVAVVLERLGANSCIAAQTREQNILSLVAVVFMLAAVGAFGLVLKRVKPARIMITGGTGPLSTGNERQVGRFGAAALMVFGVFELVHIVLSPTGVDLLGPFWAASPVTPALAAVATVVISFGLAVIPRLTLSLVGLLVGAANLLALMTGQTCRDLGGVLMIAGMFVLVWWLAQRLR